MASWSTTRTLPQSVYARFRLYDGAFTGTPSPNGLVLNGEVEDYQIPLRPTAVELVSFTASRATKRTIVLRWQTASETDNLGFNLYRATSLGGRRTRVNRELIPTLVNPGSPEGVRYTWVDRGFNRHRTYYYWL